MTKLLLRCRATESRDKVAASRDKASDVSPAIARELAAGREIPSSCSVEDRRKTEACGTRTNGRGELFVTTKQKEQRHRQSNHQQVLLQDVSLHSSGQYKCEVSAEAPSFNSVSAEGSMEVVVLPQDGPSITGEEKVYATGDVLGLNCTSSKSHPAATIKWFINGEQVREDAATAPSSRRVENYAYACAYAYRVTR
ncbi:hypothetical protein K0M31_019422 [Melipona bicolor]|uniref:Ig-like domain-containing protein n=1 Tax=Melipona bicolor TaxID=60889 RepID=A0AA40G2D7_9HYME|nr:hypothetical protein K0M31_019422 [Melipona bicolor]